MHIKAILIAAALAVAAAPLAGQAQGDSSKSAKAAPKKAGNPVNTGDPIDVKGTRKTQGSHASTAKVGKPVDKLGVVDDPFGVKGRAASTPK